MASPERSEGEAQFTVNRCKNSHIKCAILYEKVNSTSFHYVEFLIDYRSPTVRRFSNFFIGRNTGDESDFLNLCC
jgi:hypothetical protein